MDGLDKGGRLGCARPRVLKRRWADLCASGSCLALQGWRPFAAFDDFCRTVERAVITRLYWKARSDRRTFGDVSQLRFCTISNVR